MPDLQPDFAQPNDGFELSVVATPPLHIFDYANQGIELWRSNELVLFAATNTYSSGLEDTGIAISSGEELCRSAGLGCVEVRSSTRVSVDGVESVFLLGETRVLGNFSITVDESYLYLASGMCDRTGIGQVAGVALPP
jgi:hypothetical protein